MMAFPPLGREDSPTLGERWGVLVLVMAAGFLFCWGHPQVAMENRCRVFITGCVVPPFAVGTVGGKRSVAFVSGGPPKLSLQSLAVALLGAQIEGGFLLTFE